MTTQHDLHGYRNGAGPCICAACEDVRKSPHPDTARADEAERMLYECLERAGSYAEGYAGNGLVRDVRGLREWMDANWNRLGNARRLADLTARRDRERAALAATEAEIAALTEGKPCSDA